MIVDVAVELVLRLAISCAPHPVPSFSAYDGVLHKFLPLSKGSMKFHLEKKLLQVVYAFAVMVPTHKGLERGSKWHNLSEGFYTEIRNAG